MFGAIAAEESRQLEEEKARAKMQRARLFETAGGSAGEEVEGVRVRRRDLFGNKDKK
jgi:hypothetical protein